MVSGNAIASIALGVLAAGAAGYGAWRCWDLQKLGEDPRLRILAWFFGLFAVSALLHAFWVWEVGNLVAGAVGQGSFGRGGNFTFDNATYPFPGLRPQGTEYVTPALVGHHVTMLAALVIAVRAFSHRHPGVPAPVAAAAFSFAFVSDFVPLALALEAVLTLYLAAQALLNHVDRRSPGALQVAIGFLLFFAGHAAFFIAHRPGSVRLALGDVFALVGIVLLVQMLPGRK